MCVICLAISQSLHLSCCYDCPNVKVGLIVLTQGDILVAVMKLLL